MSAAPVASELTVAILPLGQISTRQIKLTADILEYKFGVKTMILPAVKIPPQFFNAERGRYQAYQLLTFLFFNLPASAQRIVGVIEGELEFNETSRCYGLADYYIGTAIYNALFPLELLPNRTPDQINRDAWSYYLIVHEFGHTFGLRHCANTACAMCKDKRKVALCADCQRWLNRELQVKPGSAEERFARAENLMLFGLIEDAVEIYKQAISQAKHEPHYHHRLAYALAKCGRLEEAKNAQVLAGVFSHGYPQFHYLFALNRLEKNPAEAEKLFAKAAAEAKDKQHVHKIIGNAYREIKRDTDKAIHHYRQYFQLGGDDELIMNWYNSRLRQEAKS